MIVFPLLSRGLLLSLLLSLVLLPLAKCALGFPFRRVSPSLSPTQSAEKQALRSALSDVLFRIEPVEKTSLWDRLSPFSSSRSSKKKRKKKALSRPDSVIVQRARRLSLERVLPPPATDFLYDTLRTVPTDREALRDCLREWRRCGRRIASSHNQFELAENLFFVVRKHPVTTAVLFVVGGAVVRAVLPTIQQRAHDALAQSKMQEMRRWGRRQ